MYTENQNDKWNWNPFTNRELDIYSRIGICGAIILIVIAVIYTIYDKLK